MPPERVPAGPAIGPLRRATRIEPPTSAAAAASVPRRPLRPRLALPELLYLSRNIVVIDVRGPLRMCISEYAPGYEAEHGISFEMATKWRQAAGGEQPVWLLSRATFPLCSHESPTPSHVQGTARSLAERIQL